MFRQLAISKKAFEEIGILWLIMSAQPVIEVVYIGVSAEPAFQCDSDEASCAEGTPFRMKRNSIGYAKGKDPNSENGLFTNAVELDDEAVFGRMARTAHCRSVLGST
jgi:hypothetical protein